MKNFKIISIVLSVLFFSACATTSTIIKRSDLYEHLEEYLPENLDSNKEDNLISAFKHLRISHDDIEGITWINPKPYFYMNQIHIYFGLKKGLTSPWLRLNIRYVGISWLFINEYIIKTDQHTYRIKPKSFEVERKVRSDYPVPKGSSWVYVEEIYDCLAESHIEMIDDIITSKNVKMRYSGESYRDWIVSYKEKKRLADVLAAYKILRNIYDNKEYSLNYPSK